MKICPVCGRQYSDDTSFCLEDGSPLQPANQPPAPQGFVGSGQPVKKGSSALPFVLGAGLLVVLIGIGLFIGLVWFAVRNNKAAAANNTKTKPAASPQTVKQPASSPAPVYNSNSADDDNSRASDAPSKDNPSDIDFSKSLTYSGTATNQTVNKSSGVKFNIVSRNDRFYIEGGLDNKNLFGKFDNVRGATAVCPKTAPENSTCVEMKGSLAFGGDGSNFPAGTKAPFTMFLIFTSAANLAAGAYEIGIIPKYESVGKQKGTLY